MNVMLDLETFGFRPGSVITSIGAVMFDNEKVTNEFYSKVDPESCVNIGMTIDPSTVQWWLKQNESARMEMAKPGGFPIDDALQEFNYWLKQNIPVKENGDLDSFFTIWGDGVNFDNALLAAAYDITGVYRPWHNYNERCYRTVKKLRPEIMLKREGTYHNALDDARCQAEHLIRILNDLNK